MVKKKTATGHELIKEMTNLFALPDAKPTEKVLMLRLDGLLNRLFQRSQLLKENFSSGEALERYLRKQKNEASFRLRIQNVVARKKAVIRQLAGAKGFKELNKSSDIAKYQALVETHYERPEEIFPEIPEGLSLCEVKTIIDNLEGIPEDRKPKNLKQILEEMKKAVAEKLAGIEKSWYAITGRKLNLPESFLGLPQLAKLPRLSELESLKAPMPVRPNWSKRLYGLEAQKMGHHLASSDEEGLQKTPAANATGAKKNLPADRPASGSEAVSGTVRDPGPTAACGERYLNDLCGINRFNLYDRESFSPLRAPSPPDLPRYTFPGALRRGEDLFYDYSLILPLPQDDCGPCCEEAHPEPRRLRAAKLLAGKAQNILGFLQQTGLSHVLGHYPVRGSQAHQKVAEDITLLLQEVCNLREADSGSAPLQIIPSSVADIRSIKHRLAEMVGIVRLISRSEMLIEDLQVKNPEEYRQALDTALAQLPKFRRKRTRLPTTNQSSAIWRDTLEFPEANDAIPFQTTTRENLWGCVNVPDAWSYLSYEEKYKVGSSEIEDEDEKGWMWRHQVEQRHDLRNYVWYLGEVFEPKLSALRDAAQKMSDAVNAFAGNYDKFKTDFERLATGLVHKAATALADVLEDIANNLTLPDYTRGEGNKRLGLQVIFRQRWHPAGYVQGKLVGYKNLLPRQKDTLKRRTFIKTVREMTTAEEFAAARQEDYSTSQKESKEVVKEASGKFNFSASASGDYDFLLVSGEYTLQTGGELAQASKTTQNKMVEFTRKGTTQYNDKREIKIRHLTEAEDVQEVSSEIENANAEITANYFYYQLLHEYEVTVEVADLRPVLLRARDVPGPAEIDEQFVARHLHILLHHLPRQLSVDAQECAERVSVLAKTLLRRKADMDQKAAELEVLRRRMPSANSDEAQREKEECLSKERELFESRQVYIQTEEEYTKVRSRMNRVIAHLRENICYYMQFIWQETPKVDADQLLREERFCGYFLPEVTRGLIRQGYYGNEEMFVYTGPSYTLLERVLENLIPGDEICAQLIYRVEGEELPGGITEYRLTHSPITPGSLELKNAKFEDGSAVTSSQYEVDYDRGLISFAMPLSKRQPRPTVNYESYEDLARTTLFQYMQHYYPQDNLVEIKNKICGMAFVADPASRDLGDSKPVLSNTIVQVAQDALVVEAMPGQVPLLEGFQMAHRMLNVQKVCLENVHLAERIADHPWRDKGPDAYEVHRYEGAPSQSEVKE